MKTYSAVEYKDEHDDKYDVLITTDVLSEGVNLHRASAIINYDLPWNPTKIMQRSGRINRVGSTNENIYIFNFFPTSQTEKHISLKDNIISKLQMFHDTLGEDFKYLSDEEEVSSHNLYEKLNSDLEDEGGVNQELYYLNLIRTIRDTNIELYDKVKKMPMKAKTGVDNSQLNNNATLTFIRKGALK
jgi:superfamily II DNA/RNA helicase